MDLTLWTWRGPIKSDILSTVEEGSFTFALASDSDGVADHAVEFSLSSSDTEDLLAVRHFSQVWATDQDGEPVVALYLTLNVLEKE